MVYWFIEVYYVEYDYGVVIGGVVDDFYVVYLFDVFIGVG